MSNIHVVGLGVHPLDLPGEISRKIAEARVLVGGQRLLDHFPGHPAVKVPIRSPLQETIERIREEILEEREVVVLSDGDPGFYGIGRRLLDAFGRDAVILYPNVTTLQAATSRMKITWDDVQTVSLHGREDIRPLLRALVRGERVAVFTDPVFDPAKVADELIRRGVDTFEMHVFENLGMEGERIRSFPLSQAAATVFSPLAFVILERIRPPEIALSPGLDDELYLHQRGLITKKEIRAVGLSLLNIHPRHTVWDMGAGCGSVAIEASITAYRGIVLAVERDPERVRLIRENIRRTGAYSVEAVQGEMPACLESLPDPDRIFIGGGAGHDNRILEAAAGRLKPDGKIVLHTVLLGSLSRAGDYLTSMKWPFSITQIQVSRTKEMAGNRRLEPL
ncbi:MAG: precorrin-6y C5,15-methyltransferase (decarboxylating) subunit CbiE, partial [Syntrophales bacterium]|nr:precorrin-6y C5,15-methyltransferase (decarboxylating) subunit CbiE [Syntrophales bacterium]